MPVPAAWGHLPFFENDWPRIERALAAETREILPAEALRFRALEGLRPADVRVVILGQDPYPEPGKATGLCFSVPRGFGRRQNDSLGNILKEIRDDLGVERADTELDGWARQGVLLLNTVLTVPAGEPKGHWRLGWQRLAGEVLSECARRPTAFLLWGSDARTMRRHIGGDGHLIVESAHPSPLARTGFRGSRPFSRVNAWLAERGEPPIDWAG